MKKEINYNFITESIEVQNNSEKIEALRVKINSQNYFDNVVDYRLIAERLIDENQL